MILFKGSSLDQTSFCIATTTCFRATFIAFLKLGLKILVVACSDGLAAVAAFISIACDIFNESGRDVIDHSCILPKESL